MIAVPYAVTLSWFSFRPAHDEPSRRLYVLRDPDAPLWHALDVANALDLTPEGLDVAEVATYLPGWEDDETGWAIPFVTTAVVRQIGADRPDFLARVDEIIATLQAGRVATQSAHAPHQNRDVVDLVDVRAETFSVVSAANILSRDPVISLGRESLFHALREFGWITREAFAYIPADTALQAGWLARNQIWNPRKPVAYNQVRLTREGLQEVQRRLGGVASLILDANPILPLVEV
ncbi:MAG: hypothetical protein ABIP33_06270 [Pseudolysinimonas sp.]